MASRFDKAPRSGTDGSNPSPSTGESLQTFALSRVAAMRGSELQTHLNTCAKHERRMPLWRCPVLGFRRARGNLHLPLPRLSKADGISPRGGRGGAEGTHVR